MHFTQTHHISIKIKLYNRDMQISLLVTCRGLLFSPPFCLVVNGFELMLSTSVVILVSDIYYSDTVECIIVLSAS